jgi:hypothetical protein
MVVNKDIEVAEKDIGGGWVEVGAGAEAGKVVEIGDGWGLERVQGSRPWAIWTERTGDGGYVADRRVVEVSPFGLAQDPGGVEYRTIRMTRKHIIKRPRIVPP